VRGLDEVQRRPAFGGKVVLQVVRWDDELSPVPFAVQDAPQDAVNQYKGLPRDCDLTLVIVWSRLGKPTRRWAAVLAWHGFFASRFGVVGDARRDFICWDGLQEHESDREHRFHGSAHCPAPVGYFPDRT